MRRSKELIKQASEILKSASGPTIAPTAFVAPTARVDENAEVSGKARVFGNAHIKGNAVVTGNAEIGGTAEILGGKWNGSEGPIMKGRWLAPGVPA